MLTVEEFLFNLEVVYAAVTGELRAEPLSDAGRQTVTNLERVLGRMVAELRQARDTGDAIFRGWREIAEEASQLGIVGAERVARNENVVAYERVQAEVTRLQEGLDTVLAEKHFLARLADAHSPIGRWFAGAVNASAAAATRYEAGVPSPVLRPASENMAVVADNLRSGLNTYLPKRFGQMPKGDIVRHLEIIPGGSTKRTALFELVPNEFLQGRLILRADIGHGQTGSMVAEEFPLLETVHAAGVPVPKPILCEKDPVYLGGTFIVVSEIAGAMRAGESFPELSRDSRHNFGNLGPEFGPELARALAKLHSLKALPSNPTGGAFKDSNAMVEEFYQLWLSMPKPAMSLGTDLGFAWLMSHPLPASRPRVVVHGDVGAHNLMVRDGHLAAILDWELAHIGDPAEDLGYGRLLLLEHIVAWEEFVRAYVEGGGDPAACDPHAVSFFGLWAHVRNSVYVAVLRKHFMDGDRRDIGSANTYWDLGARVQDYLNRELRLALLLGDKLRS